VIEKKAFKGRSLSTFVTTQEDDIQSQNKNASIELVNLINEWANAFIKSRKLVLMITERAHKEGISGESLRMLIEFALKKRGLSTRQSNRLMPAELKDSSKIHVAEESRGHFGKFDTKNSLEDSYNDLDNDDERKFAEQMKPFNEDVPTTTHIHDDMATTTEVIQLSTQKTLEGIADDISRFYLVNKSLNEIKARLSSHGASIRIMRLYYEI
jgi:hypothetical protein